MDYYNVSSGYVDVVLARVKDKMTPKEWRDFYHVLTIIEDEQMKDVPSYKQAEE